MNTTEKKIKSSIDSNSWWYRNCKTQRKKKAKICQECPMRYIIELLEHEKEKGIVRLFHKKVE